MWNEEEQMRWAEQILTRKMEKFPGPGAVPSFVVGVGHSDQMERLGCTQALAWKVARCALRF